MKNLEFSELILQLGEAINNALAESARVRQIISELESTGCKVAIMVGAEVQFTRHRSEPQVKPGTTQPGVFSAEDEKFAHALKIRLD